MLSFISDLILIKKNSFNSKITFYLISHNSKMKKLILLVCFVAFTSLNLFAQSKTDKIKELFKLMKTGETMASTIDNMTRMFEREPANRAGSKKDSLFKAYVKQEMFAFSKKIQDKDMVELYDKYFTMNDIQQYINFYNTPEGQKLIDSLPVLQNSLMTNMMKDDLPALQAKFKKKLDELEK